jgi:hypothetical protein
MRAFTWVEFSGCKLGLRFDPTKLGTDVQIAFPQGLRILKAADLAEIGAVFLALSGTAKSDRLDDLFTHLGVESPWCLRIPPTAHEVATRIVDAFCSGLPQLQDMLSIGSRREDTIGLIADQVAQVIHGAARNEQNVSNGT